ncbi:hypothetical protein HW555_012582 [Spodoptera exigua]|uniref:Uncharacterized protein n=1 Tax=Spodoptera exigua TaxID=7107 RepID=A0A835G381_SPOEX|nr:hypothetical protein HW555_012582 [Spodoptera exigua]
MFAPSISSDSDATCEPIPTEPPAEDTNKVDLLNSTVSCLALSCLLCTRHSSNASHHLYSRSRAERALAVRAVVDVVRVFQAALFAVALVRVVLVVLLVHLGLAVLVFLA